MQNNTIPDHKSPISWVPEIDLEPSTMVLLGPQSQILFWNKTLPTLLGACFLTWRHTYTDWQALRLYPIDIPIACKI